MSPGVPLLVQRELTAHQDVVQRALDGTTKRTDCRLRVAPELQHVCSSHAVDLCVQNKLMSDGGVVIKFFQDRSKGVPSQAKTATHPGVADAQHAVCAFLRTQRPELL